MRRLSRLILYPGQVGSYDGAYDWQRADDTRPPGEYPGAWPEDYCRIVEVVEEEPPR